ncbi:cytochrome c oxidase subunit 3 [Pseudogemmobacter humi]|uniref:Cytochrome c oxidase subunit 3 n=1 Tax=Pseudogemmobacter humi TaxID=2483812 RepID=A0A3P5X2I9_9RHOB|nr:cytochrome c oxidase subunit 3 [Pseudogemmobacter humi]VDC29440.1 Cytochrome c oxidase subunit 3 [Pseudogemmobacter humi]
MRLDDLPGELILWILIVSELLIFAAGITVMLVLRVGDPAGFGAAQAMLDGRLAAANTFVLVTSGLFAARAERAAARGAKRAARRGLMLAGLGGLVFLALKLFEYFKDYAAGIGMETHPFFTFYYLLTGFHAAHVLAGVAVLALVAIRARAEAVQAGAMFWHMVDLVWVLILPPLYLMR